MVGRFSTIRPTVSLSLILSLRLSSRSFLCILRLTALLVVLVLHFYPRDPCPFRTTQTRGAIRRGLRARHSDDRIRTTRGMSNNIRAATVTDDEAAARNSAARFAFFLFFSLPRSLLSSPRRVSAMCYSEGVCTPRVCCTGLSLRSPFQLIHVSIVHQTGFQPDDCYSYQPLSLIARPRASIVSMNSALNANERDAVNHHRCEPRMRLRNLTFATILVSGQRTIVISCANSFISCFYFYLTALYIF